MEWRKKLYICININYISQEDNPTPEHKYRMKKKKKLKDNKTYILIFPFFSKVIIAIICLPDLNLEGWKNLLYIHKDLVI